MEPISKYLYTRSKTKSRKHHIIIKIIYMRSYVVIQIEGGVGKNVMATAVVRAINKTYPERNILIVTAHPDVWLNNQRVHKVIQFGTMQYFYNDYISDKNSLLFLQDPYKTTDYIYRRKHVTEIWCELCGVNWDGSIPEMYFTQLENDFCQTMINKDERPILMINAFGGADNQQHKYSWARDIPPVIVQKVIDQVSDRFRVIQIRRQDQIQLNNAESFVTNLRQTALMLLQSDRRLLIDSFMQHSAAAFGLKSTVLWGCNSPIVLGYDIHDNIYGNFQAGDLKNSVYEPYDIVGDPTQIISSPAEMFDVDVIIQSLNVGEFVTKPTPPKSQLIKEGEEPKVFDGPTV
jgi:hypothetical protein